MIRRSYSVTRSAEGQSPALTFLSAAYDAMPATLNEGERVSGMHKAMQIAIECRFQFDKQDAEALKKLQITTSAGVFRPIADGYYTRSCIVGGTYPRLWEAENGIKPWIADEVLALLDHGRRDVLRNNRVAPGLCVLIPAPIDQDELTMPRIDGKQVWWCTSMNQDEMILCRYRLDEGRGSPYEAVGTPARKWKVSRDEWNALRAKHAAAAAADAAPDARNTAGAPLP